MMINNSLYKRIRASLTQRRDGKSVISDVQKAFNEGRKAYLNGVKENCCPYEGNQQLISSWHAGWQVEEIAYVDEIMEKMRSRHGH